MVQQLSPIKRGGIGKLETRLINEQSLMIYFENEISENTYEKLIRQYNIFRIKSTRILLILSRLTEPF